VRGSRGAALAIWGLLVAFVAGGCDLLLSGAGMNFGGDFPAPSQIASFSTGSASIAIAGGETIQLDQLDATSGIESMMGSDVQWKNADGWSLRLNGAGMVLPDGFGTTMGSPAYLTLDRIADGHHWTTYDPSRCVVTVETADKTAVRGTATCRGVQWYDAVDGISMEAPKPADEPPFDAEITFEATP